MILKPIPIFAAATLLAAGLGIYIGQQREQSLIQGLVDAFHQEMITPANGYDCFEK